MFLQYGDHTPSAKSCGGCRLEVPLIYLCLLWEKFLKKFWENFNNYSWLGINIVVALLYE